MILIFAFGIFTGLGVPVIAAAYSGTEFVPCPGAKAIGDTIGIITNRKTGAREQSLVEARLAIVVGKRTVGTLYVDDQGERYIERKPGASIPGLAIDQKSGHTTHPLPMLQIFGGDARLRACRPDRA